MDLEKLDIASSGPISAAIRPPGSKSITNRALVCAALAQGRSILTGVLDSEDTRVMFEALGQVGISLSLDPADKVITVSGCAGRLPAERGEIYVANSGTTARFLAAMLTLGHGIYRLDGAPRMRERPIGDLIEALRQLGADVTSDADSGCPPLIIRAHGLAGGHTKIRGAVSSQFLSGLLMAAPYAASPVEIELDSELVSQPYVTMTLEVMRAFGVNVASEGLRRFRVERGQYQGREYDIEPDASAASYFFAAAAIAGGTARVLGLTKNSLQGDVRFVEVLARMGCRVDYGADTITVTGGDLRGVDVDMNDISDTVQTLAAVALFADGPTTVRGVGHIRHKETDRIGALATELRKLGASVVETDDGLRITPGPLHGAEISTYNDHRMAMSLALVGLRVPGIVILDPGCTAKTYPDYFADLGSIRR